VASFDPIAALARVVRDDQERIVRLWAKRLRVEFHEVQMGSREVRAPLDGVVDELARLLEQRGEDAVRLWPEAVRSHGLLRYEQRFEAEDLAREFKALQAVVLRVYARRRGRVEPEVAELVAELVGEACASVQAAFARVLRTEEVRFREAAVMESVLHQVEVGILLAESDGTVTFATPPAGRLLGVPVRSLLGRRGDGQLTSVLAQVSARHEDGRPFRADDMPFRRVLAERRPVRGVRMRVERPNGQHLVLELSANPVSEEGAPNELVGVIQTLADRTEAFEKDQALSGAYEEVRRLQGELLQRTRGRALAQLAGGAAHELNNALNALRLRLQLLRREFSLEHLDALDRSVGGIGELVRRLQDFSSERAEDELVEVEVASVAREALELVRPRLEVPERPVTVAVRLEGRSRVSADRGFLRELVTGLLLAARARMPQGGRLVLEERLEGGRSVVELTDEGPPLAEEALAQLFDPFRGRSQEAPVEMALTLAVARAQVERWGGTLRAQAAAGDGARGVTWRVELPVVRALVPGAPEGRGAAGAEGAEGGAGAGAPARPAGGGYTRHLPAIKRVLVVDDDVDNARMMAEVLAEEGYMVRVAHSGEDALVLWEQGEFDAALLDALMPDLSGWELARLLRERNRDVLLAMVTGMDVRGQSRASLALVDAVFRKPVDIGALDEFLSQTEVSPPGGDAGPALHT
jgi:signal transduction histidine kinase/CheY-like chemotaxis protein